MKVDDKYRWLVERWAWHPNWKGYPYARITIKGKRYSRVLHRCVWAVAHKVSYSEVPMLDHINRDRTDNRLENLRPTNCVLNNMNREGTGRGLAEKRGKKWRSRLMHRGICSHLGMFPTERRARLVSRVIKNFLMTLEEAML